MNLSKETLTIIKNFSAINGAILFQQGSTVKTMSEGNTIIAEATISESFPSDFGIYDLGEFLSAVSIFQNTVLDFHDKYVVISDGGKSKIKFYGAGDNLIKPVPTIKFPNATVEFNLSSEQLGMIMKTSSALKADDICITGDGSTLKAIVTDKKNATANAYELELGTTDETFSANLKVDNIKILPGDYNVSISDKKISRFKNAGIDLTYYIAVESDSTFE